MATHRNRSNDPEELFEGTRRPSPAVAKEWARDGAHAGTTHGVPSAPGNPKQPDETDATGRSQSGTRFTAEGSLRGEEPSLGPGSQQPAVRPGQ